MDTAELVAYRKRLHDESLSGVVSLAGNFADGSLCGCGRDYLTVPLEDSHVCSHPIAKRSGLHALGGDGARASGRGADDGMSGEEAGGRRAAPTRHDGAAPNPPRSLTGDARDARLRRVLRSGDAGWILEAFEPLCRYVAREFFVPGTEPQDVLQEARIGLLKAVKDFRPDAGASFDGFAGLCIRRQILTMLKTAQRDKHRALNDAVPLDAPLLVGDEDSGTLADVIPLPGGDAHDAAVAHLDLEAFLAALWTLTHLERDVMMACGLHGVEYHEAAARLGVSLKAVDNAMQRGRRKLQARVAA